MNHLCSGCVALFCDSVAWSAALADDERPPSPTMTGTAVPYQTHDGYYVSNRFEPDASESTVVIRGEERFDEVFRVAATMGHKAHLLEKDAFATRLVAALIKRDNAPWTYAVRSAVVDEGTLSILYVATRGNPGRAKYATPLIVSVPVGNYHSVRFVEVKGTVINR